MTAPSMAIASSVGAIATGLIVAATMNVMVGMVLVAFAAIALLVAVSDRVRTYR